MHGRLAFFIDGAWSTGDGKRSGAVLNPATGEEIGRVPFASFDDIDRALAAAEYANDFVRTLTAAGFHLPVRALETGQYAFADQAFADAPALTPTYH